MQPGARLGPYEVIAPLGAGGMGEVYRARDTRLGRDVAIKVLPGDLAANGERLKRFEREAKATAALSHPNILAVHDVGTHDGVPYLVEELLEGGTLRERLARGAIPVSEAVGIATQIARGLAAAHEKQIVHRDLKPGNVFLTRDGTVKILDFGLAKLVESVPAEEADTLSSVSTRTTEFGHVLGTTAYMAPEQARGMPVDSRADIFAFGVVLYEMLAGKRPFRGATASDTVAAILRENPPEIATSGSGPSPALQCIVKHCLEKKPEERFQSARDIAFALQSLSGSTVTSEPTVAVKRRGSRLWLTVLAIAAALGSTFWLGRLGSRPLRTHSAPIPQLVRLTWEPGAKEWPSVSPDGASFVYQAGPSGHADIFLRRIGGETPINLTKDCPADDITPAFSPDGRSIAFRSEREGGGIFVMGATGESPRRLTDFGYEPAWSPDGKAIAVATRRSFGFGAAGPINAGTIDLWIIDVATGAKKKLYEGDGRHPTWSPSGSRIAFHQGVGLGPARRFTLSTIIVSGGAPTTVLELPSSLPSIPQWTRGWIWFISSAGGLSNVWRVPVDEATGKRTGEAEQVVNGTGSTQPCSMADGRKLLFTVGNRTLTIDRYVFDSARGRLIPEPHPVLSGPRDFRLQSASPDGEWLATVLFEDRGRQDILLVRIRTGETRRLTDDPLRENFLEWAPDGSKLYFSVAPEGTEEVWSIRPDGSGREREVGSEGKRDITGPLPSPDGRWLLVEVVADIQPHMVDLGVPLAQRTLVPLPPLPTGKQFEAWAWSPDGRWLAGYSYSPADGRRPPLYLFDTEKRAFEELVDLKSTPPWPAWLPDSRRLLIRRGAKLEVLDRVTRTLTSAGSLGADVQRVVLSPDGRSLFGMRWVVESDIWMLDYGTAP